MKNLLCTNWQAKLGSLAVALFIWIYLRNNISHGSFLDQVLSGTFSPGR